MQKEVQKIKVVKWNSFTEEKRNSGLRFLATKASLETTAVSKR